ncbi:unnamed protein product [Spirodela intermedia]|uniref:Phytocyanin domain-containing protein n=1 Tax=Spirodela intermedia TaxID=51605 RepID=A0A7I8JAZ1_SPIIN|nr:unnamed protein product [Spirodela intermedia]CAA6667376.1 unnamed protein product [Spirodela intermedia]
MAVGGSGGEKAAVLLLPPVLFLCFLSGLASAGLHVVGDKQQWRDGVNYSEWTTRSHFYIQDWLVFYFQKGMYDVVQVRNELAYNQCLAGDPVLNWSRGHSFAMQLNHTGRYYFICSRGYCYGGMKFSILVEPLPHQPRPLPRLQRRSPLSFPRSGLWPPPWRRL